MAGMLRLKREDFTRAEAHLSKALAGGAELGRLFATYELDTVVSLPVTPEVTAHVRPRPRGTRLALAELYHVQGVPERARPLLDRVIEEDRLDVVAVAALAELMLDADPVPRDAAEQIIRMTAVVENETPVHAAALLYKARALRVLGLHGAAVKTLTKAYRRKKDRPADLLRQIRYDRALGYEAIGQKRRARQELEAIYAEAPDFADVAERLGL
jgi:tetratricopeptide (TPR) repeat protein